MSTISMSEAQQFAAGLRELAEMYETYPGMPVPNPYLFCYGASPRQLVEIARAQGAQETKKDYSGETFTLIKQFTGRLQVRFSISREQVCRKVVKGTREVPETVEPAKTIPAHTEEIVEWECHPLLAPPEPERLAARVESEVIEGEEVPF